MITVASETYATVNLLYRFNGVKKSFEAAVLAGYDLIHVDPTVDINVPKGETIDFKIFDATAEKAPNTTPGELFCDGKRTLKIGVTDGFVNVLSLQMSGKRKNNIEDFLRGTNLTNWKTVN